MTRRLLLLLVLLAVAGGITYSILSSRVTELNLTGLVTTQDVVVSSQVAGQLADVLVAEGDTVTAGQPVARITSDELKADTDFYAHSAAGAASTVGETEAALKYEQEQSESQLNQAEASQKAAEAQTKSAQADLENAQLTFQRSQKLFGVGGVSQADLDQARTTFDAARAKVDSLARQVDVAKATVTAAQANAQQVAMRRQQVATSRQQAAAATAEHAKADVRLNYADIRSPVGGIIDVRAARQGEVVGIGQPIVTIVNPDDLWVRADVEETYIDRIKIGDKLQVTLPSGATREGTVFYRAADAGFATQRDVSRTKRDIRTFEIRLRVDNKDRALAVGMSAYVRIPLQ
jgi:multidrug resistance efflux pump